MRRPVDNPPNHRHASDVEWIGPPPPAELTVYEEESKSILNRNDSPDVGFRYSVNPYRGCFHGCAYCYARPSHQYLDFGAGSDFETKIVVKRNAPELLREAFRRRSWRGDVVALSGNTDGYQPLEAEYRLTRGILEVCRDFRNPVGVITKSQLVRRDIDLLSELSRVARVRVSVSIPFVDTEMARAVEPFVPTPRARFETIRALADAGIPTGVAVAPIIPGLNDDQAPEILSRAREAGARSAFHIPLRLPAEVGEVFLARIAAAFPLRLKKIENAIREMRGGRLNTARFGDRMTGSGERWAAVAALFSTTCRRLGLACCEDYGPENEPTTFRRPNAQLRLW